MNEPPVRRGFQWGVVVCAVLAVLGVVAAVAAVSLDEALLAVVAAVGGVGAAGVGALLDVRRIRAEQSLLETRAQTRSLHRQLRAAEAEAGEGARADDAPDGADWEIDRVTGLIRERHLPVVLQQVVAAARRNVRPVSVVFWEVDGLGATSATALDQALTALAAVAWRTLRESDTIFQLGDEAALAVLADTTEPGAMIVAERVREGLRASPIGDSLTVSAGIACYPLHALDPLQLVARAAQALEVARAHGFVRDHVAIAVTEP
jgi:diguanylate cyclase (GGDEF)-like protein